MKEVSEDELVKEVNVYKPWDVEYEITLKYNDDIFHEDLVSDVWYAKEDWYSVFEFVIGVFNSTRLEEDENYFWTEFITEEYFE